MSKTLNIKVNGNSYEVAVGDLDVNPVSVAVNGKEYKVEFVETAVKAAPVTIQTEAAPVVKAVKAVEPPAAATSGDAITAPMPGTIMNIAVKAGDEISAGTVVCALEAMKMKNLIKSPRAGKVASVEVTDGQKVGFGAVIIRFA
jgi:biotin carboxyl carrier protein